MNSYPEYDTKGFAIHRYPGVDQHGDYYGVINERTGEWLAKFCSYGEAKAVRLAALRDGKPESCAICQKGFAADPEDCFRHPGGELVHMSCDGKMWDNA